MARMVRCSTQNYKNLVIGHMYGIWAHGVSKSEQYRINAWPFLDKDSTAECTLVCLKRTFGGSGLAFVHVQWVVRSGTHVKGCDVGSISSSLSLSKLHGSIPLFIFVLPCFVRFQLATPHFVGP